MGIEKKLGQWVLRGAVAIGVLASGGQRVSAEESLAHDNPSTELHIDAICKRHSLVFSSRGMLMYHTPPYSHIDLLVELSNLPSSVWALLINSPVTGESMMVTSSMRDSNYSREFHRMGDLVFGKPPPPAFRGNEVYNAEFYSLNTVINEEFLTPTCEAPEQSTFLAMVH